MEDRAAYRKQKRIYLIQTTDRVTRYAVSNLKRAVEFVDQMPARALLDPLDYQAVSYSLRKYGIYAFEMGAVQNFIQVMGIEGGYRISAKKRSTLEHEAGLSTGGSEFETLVLGAWRAEPDQDGHRWQLFHYTTFKAVAKDQSEARLWIETQWKEEQNRLLEQ